MPFIGNTPDVNFTSFAKQDLTGVTGSPAKRGYTLTHAVANANEIEVFVNNVRQEPTEAYTVNGTGLTMTGDVETTDDFYILYLGKAIQTTVPPDGSVSTAKIANSAVDLTSKVTGVLPVANGGTGSSSASEINSVIETFYYGTGDHAENNNHNLDISWTRKTTNSTANKNGGMLYVGPNGEWKFPSTGIWNVTLTFCFYDTQAANSSGVLIMHSSDGGSTLVAVHGGYQNSRAGNAHSTITLPYTFNITDVANERIVFRISSGGNLNVRGGSSWNTTKAQFIKLCPSV
jgi:sRNA-binding regulator protein Hfq